MKKALWILLVLLVGLVVVAIVLSGKEPNTEPTQPLTTVSESEPETESTQPSSTEPPLEPLTQGEAVIVNGVTLETALAEETVFARADKFATAAGLGFSAGGDTAQFNGAVEASFTAEDTQMILNGEPYTAVAAPFMYDGLLYVPLLEISQALQYSFYVDEENGQLYITPGAGAFTLIPDVNVPVLMYHAVSDAMWGIQELFVSPSEMEKQLQYLLDNGYDPIWFEDLAHLEDYDKPVILTFDDGYDDNYTELYPLLQKYHVKATIFVISSAIGTSHKMDEAQICELADSGLVSIQSHTVTHEYLDSMNEESLIYEMAESKLALTRLTGREPYVLCYPTGKYSNLSLEVTARYYTFGLKMVGGLYNTSDNPFLVNRYYVSRYTGIDAFASFVSAAGT